MVLANVRNMSFIADGVQLWFHKENYCNMNFLTKCAGKSASVALRRRHYSRLFNRYLRHPIVTVRSIATFSVPARDLRHTFHWWDTPAFEYPYQPTVRLFPMTRTD